MIRRFPNHQLTYYSTSQSYAFRNLPQSDVDKPTEYSHGFSSDQGRSKLPITSLGINIRDAKIGCISVIAFSPEGQLLVAADGSKLLSGDHRDITVWDADSGSVVQTLSDSQPEWSLNYHITFSPNCKLLAAARGSGFRLWEVSTGNILLVSIHWCNFTAFSSDNKRLAVSEGQLVRVIDVISGVTLQKLDIDEHSTYALFNAAIAFAPNDQLICLDRNHRCLRLWDMAANLVEVRYSTEQRVYSCAVSVSPDGLLVAAVWHTSSNYILELRETKKGGANVWTQHTQTQFGRVALTFSADGKMLATARVSAISLYNVASGSLLKEFQWRGRGEENLPQYLAACAFSPDGKRFASSASDDGTVKWLKHSRPKRWGDKWVLHVRLKQN